MRPASNRAHPKRRNQPTHLLVRKVIHPDCVAVVRVIGFPHKIHELAQMSHAAAVVDNTTSHEEKNVMTAVLIFICLI